MDRKIMVSNKTKMVMLQLQSNRSKVIGGFTMVEVLVGTILTLVFTAIAAQTLVMATAIKVRSDEITDANTWINADLASIKSIGDQIGGYNATTDTYTPDSARCLTSSASNGHAALLQSQADPNNDTDNTDTTIGTDDSDSKKSTIGQRPYTLRRRTTIANTAPYAVLQIQYDVYRGTTTTTAPITSYYAEVIPGVAFSCRQI
jgi:type II secretory pathway pseudopilin PulG